VSGLPSHIDIAMITEVYEAFLEPGTSEDKAKVAAEALASYESRFSSLEAGRMPIQNWNQALSQLDIVLKAS